MGDEDYTLYFYHYFSLQEQRFHLLLSKVLLNKLFPMLPAVFDDFGNVVLDPINNLLAITVPNKSKSFLLVRRPPVLSSIPCQLANSSGFLPTMVDDIDFAVRKVLKLPFK